MRVCIVTGRLLATTGLFAVFLQQACAQSAMTTDQHHTVRILNLPAGAAADPEALKNAANQILQLLERAKLIPTRVEISADHPIVIEAMADKTIEIAVAGDSPVTIWVPLSHRGNRIIVRRVANGEPNFALYSLPENTGINLNVLR